MTRITLGQRLRMLLAAVGLAAAWLGLGSVVTAPAARAVAAAGGTGCSGVLVVVEPRTVPQTFGGTRTGCAASPSSGVDALRQAGFSVSLGTGSYGGGFVCGLNGAPAAGCGLVDQDTYWSYWYMAPGTSAWVYSQTGAAGRTPQQGGIDAWVWQSGGAVESPAARSAVAAPAPSGRPSTRTPASTSTAAGSRSTPGTASTSDPAEAPAGITDGADRAAAAAGGTRGPGSAAGAATAGSIVGAADPGTEPGSEPGASVGVVNGAPAAAVTPVPSGWPSWTGAAGVLLAVLLGADAVRRTRRSRAAEGK